MFLYHLVHEYGFHEDVGVFPTYGIAVFANGQRLFVRSDVFAGQEVVEDICRLCNREQVEPTHLEDVIEDML